MTSAPTSAATLLSASGIDATDDDFDFAFAGDLVSASASVDENFIATFSVRYTMESFNPERTAPTLLIDIDDNPATGASGVDSADNDAALIGPDYAISAIPAESATDAEAMVFDTDGTILGRVRLPGLVTTRDNGYDITIELSRLQDSDGEFTFAVLSQRQFDATSNSPINDYLPDVGSPKLATSRGLVASVLPASRSVQTGATATAFATIINAGRSTGIDCGLALDSDVDADFSYQTTDPLTNQSTGAPDTPTIVEPNAVQTFVLRVTPRSTRTPSDLTIRFRCANLPEAVPVNGVNTLFLAAEDTAGPDVIALALAPSGDGVVRVPAAPELGFFTLASANVGASGALTFTVDTGAVELPVSFLLCETDPLTAACINPTTPSADPVQVNIDNQGTPTFAVFVEASGTVTFDPAAFRVNARFRDSSGAIRGSTSVAITAAGPPQRILTFDSEIPGTLPTETGTGSGFPTRLPGTGTNYTGNDPNLTLDTVASELRVRSTKSDLNGEANLPAAVFPGIALSELGFTGEENFEVTAHFAGVPLSEIADQFGVYVGASGTQAVRGGYIFFSDQFGLEFYSVQTIDGLDTQLMRFTGASDVENVVNLRRTNGVYQLFINTAEVPMAQPLHLNGRSDLHVGIYASSPGSDNPIELRLLDFGARVF